MELEVYIIYLQKQYPSKFSKEDLCKLKDLLRQNMALQNSTGAFRVQVKSYNKRITKCAIEKLALLSKEYAKKGQQDIADALLINDDSSAFYYKPYMMLKKKAYGIRSEEDKKSVVETHERAKHQLESVVAELRTQPLFCEGNPAYRVDLLCVKRFNYLTMIHDILDYRFHFVRELRESFYVGITYRDNAFLKALEEKDGEGFLSWYEQETLKERNRYAKLQSEYESIMASEPDNC